MMMYYSSSSNSFSDLNETYYKQVYPFFTKCMIAVTVYMYIQMSSQRKAVTILITIWLNL